MGFFNDTKDAAQQQRFALVEFAFDPTPVYVTSCNEPIPYGGHVYAPASLTMGEITGTDGSESASFVVGDADQLFFALLAETNGAEGIRVTIRAAGFAVGNATPTPDEVLTVFAGAVDTSIKDTSGKKDEVQFSCGPYTDAASVDIPNRTIASLVRLL